MKKLKKFNNKSNINKSESAEIIQYIKIVHSTN